MKTMPGPKVSPPIFIGKWTPQILFSLKGRPRRHGELRRHLGRVSQRMLTRTLRNLESTGPVARRVTASKAIAVEYSLTQLGTNNRASAPRYVPVGKTLRQGRECRRASSQREPSAITVAAVQEARKKK